MAGLVTVPFETVSGAEEEAMDWLFEDAACCFSAGGLVALTFGRFVMNSESMLPMA